MKYNAYNIEVKKTARYFMNEINSDSVETVWFIFHGYGQLAENFIKKFPTLDNGKNLLTAPEALSRFYTDNGSGKIGASWMTREDRENEIKDYTAYLNGLYELILEKLKGKTFRFNVFAFSQGASTASRWLQSGGRKADRLILWGGFLPPDFKMEQWNKSFNCLHIITGKEDEYFPPGKLEEGKIILDAHSVNYKVRIFEGGHEMKEKAVNEIMSEYL